MLIMQSEYLFNTSMCTPYICMKFNDRCRGFAPYLVNIKKKTKR